MIVFRLLFGPDDEDADNERGSGGADPAPVLNAVRSPLASVWRRPPGCGGGC